MKKGGAINITSKNWIHFRVEKMYPATSKQKVAKKKFSLKKSFFCHSQLLNYLLNFEELIPVLLNTHLKVLSKSEMKEITKLSNKPEKTTRLLVALKTKEEDKIRKFIACLLAEPEHSGHRELVETIMKDLPVQERRKINSLFKKATLDFHSRNDLFNVDLCELEVESYTSSSSSSEESDLEIDRSCTEAKPSPSEMISSSTAVCSRFTSATLPCRVASPPLPPPLITLRGHLKGPSYDKIDRRLWEYFSTGQYDNLSALTSRMIKGTKVLDFQIIGKWFQSLILMHRNREYSSCINECLRPALELCQDPSVENPDILQGRILQRMAQVHLVMNDKEEARSCFERAQESLQFVGRSYEKVNMLCRRAKILSATSPRKRKETEEAFVEALTNVRDDDSFALASKPSLILSKAAFHLHMSFGAKPDPSSIDEPQASHEDIKKAEATLHGLPEGMLLLDMRKCEFQLLTAELERMSGEGARARESFWSLMQNESFREFLNLIAIARQRVHLIDLEFENMFLADMLLEGLPPTSSRMLNEQIPLEKIS